MHNRAAPKSVHKRSERNIYGFSDKLISQQPYF
jgi:hypothetical protein